MKQHLTPGYYWVKFNGRIDIANFTQDEHMDYWWLPGIEWPLLQSDFEYIHPERIICTMPIELIP